jgi:hypothetical protein
MIGPDREALLRERDKIRDHIVGLGRKTEEHLKSAHADPARTCHMCVNLTVGIQSDRENLQDIENELNKL